MTDTTDTPPPTDQERPDAASGDDATEAPSSTDNATEEQDQGASRWLWLALLVLFALGLGVGALFGVQSSWQTPPELPPAPPVAADPDTGTPPEPDGGAQEARVPADRIYGVVLGDDGTPLPGAQITIEPLPGQGAVKLPELPAAPGESDAGQAGEPRLVVTTDSRGTFAVAGLPVVEYRLEASAPGHASRVVGRIVPAPTPIQLQLTRGGGRAGEVVNAETGQGVEGAEVRIGGAGYWPPVVVETDLSGRFELPPLPAGRYELLVRWRGPGLTSLGARTSFEHGGEGGRGPLKVALEPTPTTTLRVVDAGTGMGLPGALVTLAEDVVHVLSVSEWTDLDGELSLYGIPAGDYTLQIKAGGYLEVNAPLALVLEAAQESEDALEDDVIDIPLQPAGSLQGVVVDAVGNPLGLAQVVCHVVTETGAAWVMSRDTSANVDPLVAPAGEMAPASFEGVFGFFSDAEGYFEVTGLPAGSVVLEARRQGYQPTWAGPFVLSSGGALSGIELRLRPGHRLTGRVVNAEGDPVEDARVRIQPAVAPALEVSAPTQRPELPLVRSLFTDEEGRFEARDLPDAVIVRADTPGTLEASLTVALEGREDPVELRLEPPGDAIEGQVLLEGELGLAKVLLKAADAEGTGGMTDCIAVTDEDGRFVLTGCPDEPFWVMVAPEDPELVPSYVKLTPGDREARVTVERGVVLAVTVVDAADRPLTGVLVEARVPGPAGAPRWLEPALRRSARSDTNGLALLETGPAGRWTLEASREGWIREEATWEASAERREVTLTLQRARLVQGAVVDAYGAGIADSRVSLAPLGGGKARHVKTDAEGRFKLEVAHAEAMRIEALHPRYGRGALAIPASAEAVEEAIVTLTRPNIDLDAWNARLAPFGATLWRDGDAIQVLELEPDGVAAASGVSRGDYVLSAEAVREGVVRVELVREERVATITLIQR